MTIPPNPPKTVLLVEDVAVNRRVAAAFLSKNGYAVVEAVTGTEALEKAHGQDFDLILLDIRLPDMDGVDVAAQIRSFSHSQRAQTPILALTANVFPDDIRRYRNAGMNGVVAKPIQLDQFRAAVASLLHNAPVVVPAVGRNVTSDSQQASGIVLLGMVLDKDFIAERRRTLGPATFDAILQLGRRSMASAVQEVAEAAALGQEAGAPLALAKAGHKLAGSASNFGFSGLFALGQQIETLADPRDGSEPQWLVAVQAAARVPDLHRQTLDALENWLMQG